MVDGGVLQHRVALERLGQEAPGHRRGAEQQGLHVEPHDRGGQQADRREDREPAADAVGDGQDFVLGEPVRLTQVAELAGRARDRDDVLAQLVRAVAVETGEFACG